MRVILLGILFSVLVLGACKKKIVRMDYKLNDDQLTHLMYDVQLSDAAIMGVSGHSADSLKTLLWTRLTTSYGLSKADIKSEIEKLQSDPEKMKTVFDSIKVWSDTIK